MKLGRLGVWTFLDTTPAAASVQFARRIEALGYAALWIPEAVGRDPFAFLAYLVAHTDRLVLATGIANIYARDPMAMRALQKTMAELSGGRFVLGLGVSHEHLVSGLRQHEYKKPVAAMSAYLDAMQAAFYRGVEPAEDAPIVLAALRPAMLRLAGDRARGAHPYFTPPEHTARARAILGSDAWLAPEQMVLRERDPVRARAVARANMQIYLGLPNYRNNLKWLGFTDDDLSNGGSDRLVDAIVAWGDEAAIMRRIEAHYAAGADHVAIQPLRPDGEPGPDVELLEALAPARRSEAP
jgi:probable F420-dependent oxidoreductase